MEVIPKKAFLETKKNELCNWKHVAGSVLAALLSQEDTVGAVAYDAETEATVIQLSRRHAIITLAVLAWPVYN